MERKEERVMARQSIFKFNERVTTEAKDATYANIPAGSKSWAAAW